MHSLLPAGVAAVGGIVSNALNISNQNKQNQNSQRHSWEMYAQQRRDAMSDWNMQNAYNDPSAQMARLKEAGLNPNLVYGNGATAQSSQGPRGSSAPTPTFQAAKVNMDAGSVALMALQAEQMKANIARTHAETSRVEADTQSMLYNNKMLTPGMFEMEYNHRFNKGKYGSVNEETNSHIKRLEAETANLVSGYRREHDSNNRPQTDEPSKNLSVEKMKADIQNIVDRNTGIQLENALKRYETEVIEALSVSGSHAGSIISNILKLILLSKN